MLTGFDSKWVNTLYLDKVMEYENLIQAFFVPIVYLIWRINRLALSNIIDVQIQWKKILRQQLKHTGDIPTGLFVDVA